MSPAVEIFVIVAAGLVSGFVNTLASSGSAVTLPLMIFRGLPATVANGTNRVPLLAGAPAALLAFHRAGVLEGRDGLFFLIPGIAGTGVGAGLPSALGARGLGWGLGGAGGGAVLMAGSNTHGF